MTVRQPDPEYDEIIQRDQEQPPQDEQQESSGWMSIPAVVRVAMIIASVVVIAGAVMFLGWVAIMIFTGTSLLGF